MSAVRKLAGRGTKKELKEPSAAVASPSPPSLVKSVVPTALFRAAGFLLIEWPL